MIAALFVVGVLYLFALKLVLTFFEVGNGSEE